MKVFSIAGIVLTSLLPNMAVAGDFLKSEFTSVSPNNEYAIYSRITVGEWIRNSWKFPIYPFAIAIGGKAWPLTTNFKRKCTITNRAHKDLFPCPKGGGAIWSPEGNRISANLGAAEVLLIPEKRNLFVPADANARLLWLSENELLVVTLNRQTKLTSFIAFNVLTEKKSELGNSLFPEWSVGISEMRLCPDKVNIQVGGEVQSTNTSRAIISWDLNKHVITKTVPYRSYADNMSCYSN